ncbi:MAG: RNA polymerase sigma factor [Bacteroidia bacterium]
MPILVYPRKWSYFDMQDVNIILRKKNKETVALLYERFGKKLYGYGISKWKLSEDDAWDLIYKTLYRVMDVADRYTFEDEGKLSSFIFTTFINYLRNHYRDTKAKGLVTTELLESHEKMSGDRREMDEEAESTSPLMRCLQKALAVLDDWQRVLMLMRAQDYAYEEISKYVSRPGDQLKTYYMRLKKVVTEKTNDCMNKKA